MKNGRNIRDFLPSRFSCCGDDVGVVLDYNGVAVNAGYYCRGHDVLYMPTIVCVVVVDVVECRASKGLAGMDWRQV